MSKKVTKEQFIQAIENNEEGLTNIELARQLGISITYFYDLRHKYKVMVRDRASEMAQSIAIEQVHNLARNARKGDTQAAKTLLEMAGSYIPSSKRKLEVDAANLGVIQVPTQLPVGAPVSDYIDDKDEKNGNKITVDNTARDAYIESIT